MIGGNVTEKITPETYHKMNEEFEEEGLAFRIIVPTQDQIDCTEIAEIADALGGKLVHITCVDHTGRDYKRIVIEYEEKKVMDAVIYSNGNQECERAKTLLEKLNFQILCIN